MEWGFPNVKNPLPECIQPYWSVRHSLSVEDSSIILKGYQIVIPKATLPRCAAGSTRITPGPRTNEAEGTSSGALTRTVPNDIDNMIRNCPQCHRYRPLQQKDPLLHDPVPTLPYQRASVDIFSCSGNSYIVYTDHLSGWPCIDSLAPGTRSKDMIRPFC